MNTTTFGTIAAPRQTATKKGRLARLWQAIIDARTAEARRRVDGYLATLDDATLARLGLPSRNIDPVARKAAVSRVA